MDLKTNVGFEPGILCSFQKAPIFWNNREFHKISLVFAKIFRNILNQVKSIWSLDDIFGSDIAFAK